MRLAFFFTQPLLLALLAKLARHFLRSHLLVTSWLKTFVSHTNRSIHENTKEGLIFPPSWPWRWPTYLAAAAAAVLKSGPSAPCSDIPQ